MKMYYGSNMGRFMSPDWAAKAMPVLYAKLGDPQTLNLYAYVGNNPLSRVDADGHVVAFGDDAPQRFERSLRLCIPPILALRANSSWPRGHFRIKKE
jgi:hypothetical protein